MVAAEGVHEDLARAAQDARRVQGATHRFYRYPARFSPHFVQAAIEHFTDPGDLVLDNTMGSATLPVACIRTGRHFIGIEKDDVYFAASVERVKAALAQQAFSFDAPPV